MGNYVRNISERSSVTDPGFARVEHQSKEAIGACLARDNPPPPPVALGPSLDEVVKLKK